MCQCPHLTIKASKTKIYNVSLKGFRWASFLKLELIGFSVFRPATPEKVALTIFDWAVVYCG